MATKFPDIFAALLEEFPDTKHYDKTNNIRLYYINARQVMDRLDEVLGMENWWDEYEQHEKCVICKLTIQLRTSEAGESVIETITKQGIGGFAGMGDEAADEKSAESDSLKRAAVKFGIGRYLYSMNKKERKVERQQQRSSPPPAQGNGHSSPPPSSTMTGPTKPQTATQPPPSARPAQAPPPQRAEEPAARKNPFKELPTAGSTEVYYWCKAIGEHYSAPIVEQMQKFVAAGNWSREWKSWNKDQVAEVIRRVGRYCKRLPNYKQEFDGIDTSEPKEDLDKLRDAVWDAVCDIYKRDHPGVTVSPDIANELCRFWSHGEVQDLSSCASASALKGCAAAIQHALSK